MLNHDVMVGPQIICIDGTDGTGKSTMSDAIRDILQYDLGKKVSVISPPFYNTLPGKMVWEFLHKGWGDVRDRKVLSAFYSNDRNWWLRDHFQQMMFGGTEFVITNRWALSNVLHNTTLQIPNSGSRYKIQLADLMHDSMTNMPQSVPTSHWGRVYRINVPAAIAAYLPREFLLKTSTVAVDLGSIYHLCDQYAPKVPDGDHDKIWDFWQKLRLTADYIRCEIIKEHCNFVYDMEIAPWWVQNGDGMYMPFANINTVVLNSVDPSINMDNVKKRYGGDESQMDINEASTRYQQSVIENVWWIYYHHEMLTDQRMLTDVLSEIHWNSIGCPYLIDPIDIMPLEPQKYPPYAFDFQIVETGKYHSEHNYQTGEHKEEIIQKSKEEVLRGVWKALGFHQQFPDYDITAYKFKDEAET